MLPARRHRAATGPIAKTLAACVAALVLFAQLAAAAHYHQLDRSQVSAQTAAAADDGLCPLCILALQVLVAPGAHPVVVRPQLQFHVAQDNGPLAFISRKVFRWLTRAPPPSV